MSFAFAIAAAFTLGQGGLELTNARTTYGFLGTPRKEAAYLPGDHLCLTFNIEGLKVDSGAKAQYSIGMEVANSKGRKQFTQEPRDLEAVNALGGNSLPGYAQVDIGLDQEPGEYTLKLTVADRSAKVSKTLTKNFTVLPRGFGLVRLMTTFDSQGQVPAPSVSTAGEGLYVHLGAIGFVRDRTTKQPQLAFEMRVLDDNGDPTLPKPFAGEIKKGIEDNAVSVPINFLLPLNRAGKFTIELKATDKVSGKTTKVSFPHTVLESK